MYIYEYMYARIYMEGGLGSEKIWGATVDKWEGKIGAKFLNTCYEKFGSDLGCDGG